MRWRCSYHDAKGIRCENEAIYRLHFAADHPFDHVDVCEKHQNEYTNNTWIQDLFSRDREIRE
jgi:hypothetical protein